MAQKVNVYAEYNKSVVASLAVANSYSGPIKLFGIFNFSLSGSFVGTAVVRRSFDSGSSWVEVETFTSPVEIIGEEPEKDILYDWGVNSGYYTSGSINGRLGQ